MEKKSTIAISFLNNNNDLICPICKEHLKLDNKSLKCTNNHTYDISKKGTVTLINNGNLKASLIYNVYLFENRREFIKNNYYKEVYKSIINIINKYEINNIKILDLGCGEGLHSINIINNINKEYIYYGFDYSKDAISLASDFNDKNRLFFCADVNNIPIKSNSIDIIIDFLSPYNEKEIKRLLKNNGIFIKISPGKEYLKELRKELNLNEYEKEKEVLNNLNKHFSNIKITNIKNTYKIKEEDIKRLVEMTPINTKNNNINISEITIDLNLYVIGG